MQSLSTPRVLPKVIERYFETLDFVWEVRESVVHAPDWTLEELAEHEERAAAQLDGLLLAGGSGARLARPAIVGEEVFAATAATFVLMGTGVPEHVEQVLQGFEGAGDEAREGIRIGLRHSVIEPAVARLSELAEGGPGPVRVAAADVLAFHRRALPDLQALLDDEETPLREMLYRAYGRLWLIREMATLERALESEDPVLRRAALEAAARSGLAGLDQVCRAAAARRVDPDPVALGFLGVLGHGEDLTVLQRSFDREALAGEALAGAGALGRVEAIPWIIEAMETPELAPDAGAAFARISGIDADELRAPAATAPPDEVGGEGAEPAAPPEDPADRPPDPGRARAIWCAIEDRFDPTRRWQAGRDVDADGLPMVFNALPLEARRDLYLGARARFAETVPDLELEQRAALQLGGG